MFSKLKTWMRAAKARAFEAVIDAMGDGPRAVRPKDLIGWFRQSGYQVQQSSDTPKKKSL